MHGTRSIPVTQDQNNRYIRTTHFIVYVSAGTTLFSRMSSVIVTQKLPEQERLLESGSNTVATVTDALSEEQGQANDANEVSIEINHALPPLSSTSTQHKLFSNELFLIVKSGDKKISLQGLLTPENLGETDSEGKTILHHAVKFGNRNDAVRMTKTILGYWGSLKTPRTDIVNQQVTSDQHHDKNKTALHLAAESASESIVLLLFKHGVDFTLCDGNNQTALDLIYINLPRLTLNYFSHGVNYDDSHEKIEVDFNKLTNIKGTETEPGNVLQETKNFEGLLKECPDAVKEVLNHPLMQAFLYFKYRKAYPFIIASIFIHIFWHALYAYFIFNVYYTNCPWVSSSIQSKMNGTSIETEMPSSQENQIHCDPKNFETHELGLAITCWTLGILFFAKELFEMLTVPSCPRYFFELENVGQLSVIASVFLTSWPIYEYIGDTVIAISPWQYKVACVTVFIVWALVLGQICKIQQLRILIEIFIKVFKSFLRFICTFASLLFAFAFSFCIIMPEGKAFKSPWLAVPKVLVMMTGELNYDDVFHTEDGGSGASPSHYFTTQLLFALFTILMSMILLNLLIGLAVTDTQELRANCHSAELSSMLEEIFLLESFAARVYKVTKFKLLLEALSIRKKNIVGKDEVDYTNHHRWSWITAWLGTKGATLMKPDGLKYSYSFAKMEKYPFPSGLMEDLRKLADGNTEDGTGTNKLMCQNCWRQQNT